MHSPTEICTMRTTLEGCVTTFGISIIDCSVGQMRKKATTIVVCDVEFVTTATMVPAFATGFPTTMGLKIEAVTWSALGLSVESVTMHFLELFNSRKLKPADGFPWTTLQGSGDQGSSVWQTCLQLWPWLCFNDVVRFRLGVCSLDKFEQDFAVQEASACTRLGDVLSTPLIRVLLYLLSTTGWRWQ